MTHNNLRKGSKFTVVGIRRNLDELNFPLVCYLGSTGCA
jgi:hypothetical protein